ncbi:MAG: thioredoxin [Deltaproteobacteria bacterium]|jgi:thioredoxin|nr:thioredoxin [Deltaproteobacteria bacterium]MBW2534337.1 thioredoxin [Deltaproteobacteria bacterium]
MSKRNKHPKRAARRRRPGKSKPKAAATIEATNPVQVHSKAEFDRYVEDALPVVVDFWAPWCAPCRMMAPIFEEVGKQFEGRVHFLKVDTEEVPEVAQAFGVRSIPTVVALHCTDVVDSHVGLMSAQALATMAQRADDRAQGVTLRQRLTRMFRSGETQPAAAP